LKLVLNKSGYNAMEVSIQWQLKWWKSIGCPLDQQARVCELLWKNREEGLTALEEEELDAYMNQMDQALEATAEEMLKLAEGREQNQPDR